MAARPSITAVTVIPLRPGLRCRLLRAIAPSRAKINSSGRANQSAIGATTAGATRAVPTRKTTAPNPTRLGMPVVSPKTEATMRANPIQAR